MKAIGFLSREFPDFDSFLDENRPYIRKWVDQFAKWLPCDDFDTTDQWDEAKATLLALAIVADQDLDNVEFPIPSYPEDEDFALELAGLIYVTYIYLGLEEKGLISYDPKTQTYCQTAKGKQVDKSFTARKGTS